MSSSIVAVSVCQWRERLLKDAIVWICVVNGDGAVAKISWTTGSFHWFPCFVQGLLQRAGHCRHPSERCPAPLPLFPWTLGMRQTLEKRFIKEQRMAISSSPASPDRGENRPRELLESETIVWGGTNSYSGIDSILCNKAEDLYSWQIFSVWEHMNCRHAASILCCCLLIICWIQMQLTGWGSELLYIKAHHKAAALHSPSQSSQNGGGLRQVRPIVGIFLVKTRVHSRSYMLNDFVVW